MPNSFSVNSRNWLFKVLILNLSNSSYIKPMKFSMITGNLTIINLVAAFLLVFLTSQAVSQNCKFHVFHIYNARSAFMHIWRCVRDPYQKMAVTALCRSPFQCHKNMLDRSLVLIWYTKLPHIHCAPFDMLYWKKVSCANSRQYE